jgi:ribonuclease HI
VADEVERIAERIARLPPGEKQRLFEMLAARGDLPPPGQGPAHQEATTPEARSRGSAHVLNREVAHIPNQGADYRLVFDGGSRGNPGWGYGSYAIMRLQDGAQRLERLELGDGYTNNEAEYDTLVAALEDLIRRIEEAGRRPEEFGLEVRGDSALVLNQIQGRWQAREPRMQERRDRCRQLLQRFRAADIEHQPREASVRILGH